MRYAIHFVWKDGFKDSFNADSAKERDMNIQDMIQRDEFKEIHYEPIYKSGERGMHTQVIGDFTV